jgi:hypothetical protein
VWAVTEYRNPGTRRLVHVPRIHGQVNSVNYSGCFVVGRPEMRMNKNTTFRTLEAANPVSLKGRNRPN